MVKMLIAGVWGAVMAFAGAYLNVFLSTPSPEGKDEGHSAKIEQVQSELTGVPMIEDGRVTGYLVFRFNSTIDAAKLGDKPVEPLPYLLDAAFRSCYEYGSKGIHKIRPDDIEAVGKDIADRANKRFGADAVIAVNLEQFNFIRSDEIREKVLGLGP
jgi:hypothetical protein